MSTNPSPTGDAYALLSKPTLDLTDADVETICTDLRKRRERFLAGQKDNAPKQSKPKVEMTPEAKQQNSAEVLNDIGNLF
jgi:hypothetical protein